MELTKAEIKRYNRHIILSEIGVKGQLKLKTAKVLVVGAGGLGCPVLLYLAAAGVGTIGVCDFDFVDESNLQRQVLFGSLDIGMPKAIVAAEKLSKINPLVRIIVHNLMLTKHNALEIFKEYDIIVDGSDNFPTRFLINDACLIVNKPYVFGAIYKFEGQVSVFNYQNGPTYRCLVPEQPVSSEVLTCSKIGVLGVLPGIIGAYQANEVIKMITGLGSVLSGKLLMIDTIRLEHNLISLRRTDNISIPPMLGDYGEFCNERYSDIKQISPQDLYKKMEEDDVLVFDIREKEIFDLYHIKSKQLSIGLILENQQLIPDDQQVVLVCESGVNSMAIIEELQKSGNRDHLYNLAGGIDAWMKSNLPVIKTNL
jgi:adenylyltransferase/sulfurtransferase